MLRYLILDLVMLSVFIGFAYAIGGKNVLTKNTIWLLLPLFILTAIFDNILTGLPIVTYVGEHIAGIYIGTSPIEDFAYALAAVILVPVLRRRFYGNR